MKTPVRLLDPTVLLGLANLELVARTVVAGVLNGIHRSPRLGFSQEFAEYRAYEPGDDVRHIDWSAFARTDRAVVKRYFGDTNHQLMIAVDTSASMGVGLGPGVDKWNYARFVAAALVYLAARQHDAVGMLAFGSQVHHFAPPGSRSVQIRRIYHELEAIEPDGPGELAVAFRAFAQRVRSRTLLVMISDFHEPAAHIRDAITSLGARGHEALLVQVLAAGEREPDFRGAALLEDVESGQTMAVSRASAQVYQARLKEHISEVGQAARAGGAHHVCVSTDEPLDRVLGDYLRFRSRA